MILLHINYIFACFWINSQLIVSSQINNNKIIKDFNKTKISEFRN